MTPQDGQKLTTGDIVQLAGNTGNLAFAYCLMIVDEVKSWGVQGYVQALGTREEIGGQAFYRAPWDEIESTGGKARWLTG